MPIVFLILPRSLAISVVLNSFSELLNNNGYFWEYMLQDTKRQVKFVNIWNALPHNVYHHFVCYVKLYMKYFIYWTANIAFSNSLIIHEEKTKEIITVKEVWICDPNYHKISVDFCFDFLQELSMLWEAISNTRKRVSSDIQTLRSWLKKTRLRLVFTTHFSVFDIWWNTLPRIWYITSSKLWSS